MLPVVVIWSSTDGVAIRYVLPDDVVFKHGANGPESSTRLITLYFNEIRQVVTSLTQDN